MKGCCRYAAPTCGWNEERDGLGAVTVLIDQDQTTTLAKRQCQLLVFLSVGRRLRLITKV